MIPRTSLLAAFVLLSAAPLASLRAEVSFFPLFSDHAVLQASDHVPVWGRSAAGESITVTLGGDQAHASAVAGPDGKWTATLDLAHVGAGPFELVAAGTDSRAAATDVIVGEVWLCSGQSNMEFNLKNAAGAKEEIAHSANPMLRQFRVNNAAEPAPAATVRGRWEIAGPETSGGFTAVGYYFGKKIQATTGKAVGLIHSSWGGTPVEAWISKEGFAASHDANLQAGAEKARADTMTFQKFVVDYKAWLARSQRQDRSHPDVAAYTAPAKEGDGWHPVTLPGFFAEEDSADLPDAGAVWAQRTVTFQPGSGSHGVGLFLGEVRGGTEVYWNGKKVGSFEPPAVPAKININGSDMKPGENLLAVRFFQPDRGAGIAPGASKFLAESMDGSIPLAGPWLAKKEYALPALAAGQEAPSRPPGGLGSQNTATYLYDGMISPLVPCALRGVLWYQGESNASRAQQYREAFPLMISDWRTHWGRGDLPFYFCQLANYQKRREKPVESEWAELRDAQTSALRLPNTGEAILIDLGEEADIHPKNKLDVGERLARIALAKDYGQAATVWSGPVLDKMTVAGGAVRLKFKHADGGLKATPIPPTYKPRSLEAETKPNVRFSPGGQVEGFAVCGQDHQWHWATSAEIDGNDGVVVRCAEVPAPVAVRYAWGENPLCNLANGAGLPAGPFRTDDFPLITEKGKY